MSPYIDIRGRGPELVLLHGWGMHGGVWEPVVDRLAESFRVHVVDLPGLGHSGPIAPYDLETLAAELANALPDATAVCGWSLGGQIAMRWALQRPQQVERLILVGTTPRFVNGPDWDRGIAAEVFRDFAAQVRDDYRGTLSRFLALQAHGGDAARETVRSLRERFFDRSEPQPETLQAGLDILLHTDLRAEVSALTQPALVLHGDYDKLAPVAAGHWLAENLSSAELAVCGGASHAPFLSHPSWFVAAIEEFMHG